MRIRAPGGRVPIGPRVHEPDVQLCARRAAAAGLCMRVGVYVERASIVSRGSGNGVGCDGDGGGGQTRAPALADSDCRLAQVAVEVR